MKDHVAAIVGAEVISLEPLTRGGNSRVYRARTASESFFVKVYPPTNSRPRLETETRALQELHAAGLSVPRFIGQATGERLAVHEWIDGTPVTEVGKADIEAAIALILGAQSIANRETFAPASAACLSLDDAITQLQDRLEAAREIREPSASRLVANEIAPAVASEIDRCIARAEVLGLDRSHVLGPDEAVLSPSDVGFHNALRLADQRLVFCDFEYFGWDDPAKLVADIALHPSTAKNEGLARPLAGGLRPLIGDERRLEVGYPIWGLCWCMIVLNAFLPNRWRLSDDHERTTRLADARRRLADIGTPWQLWTNAPKS